MAKLLVLAALLFSKAMAVDNGLAITPQMGWSMFRFFLT